MSEYQPQYKLSPEKLETLMTKVFGLGDFYDAKTQTFNEVGKDGTRLIPQEKAMYDALLEIAETHTGAEILSQLDENKPINLIYNPIQRPGAGADADPTTRVVSFYDTGLSYKQYISGLLLHELNHMLQFQQGWGKNYIFREDTFMFNLLHEAEARLTNAKHNFELCYGSHKYDRLELINSDMAVLETHANVLPPLPPKTPLNVANNSDIPLPPIPTEADLAPKTVKFPLSPDMEKKVNLALLDYIYKDNYWSNFYVHETSIPYSRYNNSILAYMNHEHNNAETTLSAAAKRLHLDVSDITRFTLPESVSNYPYLAVPSKHSFQHTDHQGNSFFTLCENGHIIKTGVYCPQNKTKLIEINDQLYTSQFDDQGKKVCSSIIDGNTKTTTFYNDDRVSYIIESNSFGEITGVRNGFDKQLLYFNDCQLINQALEQSRAQKNIRIEPEIREKISDLKGSEKDIVLNLIEKEIKEGTYPEIKSMIAAREQEVRKHLPPPIPVEHQVIPPIPTEYLNNKNTATSNPVSMQPVAHNTATPHNESSLQTSKKSLTDKAIGINDKFDAKMEGLGYKINNNILGRMIDKISSWRPKNKAAAKAVDKVGVVPAAALVTGSALAYEEYKQTGDIKEAAKTFGKSVKAPAVQAVAMQVGMAGAAKATEKVTAKVVEKKASKTATKVVAKTVGKTAGKAAGKAVLKKIPLISLGAGAYFAWDRVKQGEYAKAGGELLSGLSGCFPGLGTVASTAIDCGLAAADVSEVIKANKKQESNQNSHNDAKLQLKKDAQKTQIKNSKSTEQSKKSDDNKKQIIKAQMQQDKKRSVQQSQLVASSEKNVNVNSAYLNKQHSY